MAVRPIVLVPDPVLRAVAVPVERFDEDLRRLATDMLETMYAAPGRGLAAPQVGGSLRLFVMDAGWREGAPDPQAFANPRIEAASEAREAREEGCLSIPDRIVRVSRPAAVTLAWQDLDGAPRRGAFEGFAATCVQHEIDHLDGVLCTDLEEPAEAQPA
jgi:peptide deformylase